MSITVPNRLRDNGARRAQAASGRPTLPKMLTGIAGLDVITGGGLPRGRPTLVCGGPGCGKTLFALEFLVRGAQEYGEPGVFLAFEETEEELAQNVAALGFDLNDLIARKLLLVDYIYVERSEIEETGEYDLEGLFIRLGHAVEALGAKRVALDTLETLFSGLSNTAILRAELRRLFRWLKARGLTTVITAERGQGALTRHGLEEYVSDCVILLDHRVADQISTRRLRVVKYRGSPHGANEYPFLIDENGLTVMPITSLGLDHAAPTERVSSGIAGLDEMLGGGYYCASSVLVSGTAGAGKSSVAAHFAEAAVRRGERCLYFAFEESPQQIIRNMRSLGLNLEPGVRQNRLRFHAVRPTAHGLEMHLVQMYRRLESFQPQVVVVDPITDLLAVGAPLEVRAMLTRLIDALKTRAITAVFTSLTSDNAHLEQTSVAVSSLIDTWLVLRDIENNGERNRLLHLLKSRGMAHSNQVREFLLTDHGIELLPVYVGPGGVVTGAARLAQEAREQAEAVLRHQDIDRQQRVLDSKRELLKARVAALQAEFERERDETERQIQQAELHETRLTDDRLAMQARRAESRPNARQAATKRARRRAGERA